MTRWKKAAIPCPSWHKIKIVLGLALCVVGVAGALVPVIPGVPILLAGVTLIGINHPLLRGLKDRRKRWRTRP